MFLPNKIKYPRSQRHREYTVTVVILDEITEEKVSCFKISHNQIQRIIQLCNVFFKSDIDKECRLTLQKESCKYIDQPAQIS